MDVMNVPKISKFSREWTWYGQLTVRIYGKLRSPSDSFRHSLLVWEVRTRESNVRTPLVATAPLGGEKKNLLAARHRTFFSRVVVPISIEQNGKLVTEWGRGAGNSQQTQKGCVVVNAKIPFTPHERTLPLLLLVFPTPLLCAVYKGKKIPDSQCILHSLSATPKWVVYRI